MSSPNPNHHPHEGWISHNYQQPPPPQPLDNRYSEGYASRQSYYAPHPSQGTPYIQPYYGNTSTVPIIAELPASLPPAPPTTTSEEQLKRDQLLAHEIQRLDVAETRRRAVSDVTIRRRPVSMAPPVSQNSLPQLHQVSSLSLLPQPTNTRPISMAVPARQNASPQLHHASSHSLLPQSTPNMSTSPIPWGPASFGARNTMPALSSLPEVVVQPRSFSYDPANDLPIPVIQDRQSSDDLHRVSTNPISLPAYLEEHRQVPYPPTWRPPPVIATFYAYNGSKAIPGSDWLSQQESFTWRTIRPTEHAYNPAAPSYTFNFTTKGGSFRDPKFSWSMVLPEQPADPKSDPKKKVSKSKHGHA
jgi:hypothetical protein